MSQPRYLFRSGRDDIVQAEKLRVTQVERKRDVGRLGPFRQVEGTGKAVSGVLRIAVNGPGNVRLADGRKAGHNRSVQIERNAAAVKGVVRILRPQEAEDLQEWDDRIEELEAEIAAIRQRRAAIIRAAWPKANVVRLAEIEQEIGGMW